MNLPLYLISNSAALADKYMNKSLRFDVIFILFVFISLICADEVKGQTELTAYFKDTEYELDVYKIKGAKNGPTLMIIGGIQGDESGGYLSADLYADIALRKGNLIVVPRANLLSIIRHRRQINKDMNRQFNITPNEQTYEDKIVEILEELINKSDYLLNLHEGSGYYSLHWVNDMINPMKFGQSIIADSDEYKTKNGHLLHLGKLAKTVAENVNKLIENPNHQFKFNNHRTFEWNTPHPEQRKSATFFALSRHNIPAFGIETSKEISNIETKIRYQTMVINEFIKQLGLVPEQPKITLDPPQLKYLVVSVNGSDRIIRNSESLKINKGDKISISHIEANYTRGLTVDILGMGNLNDLNKTFELNESVKAIVRKDNINFGQISIIIDNKIDSAQNEIIKPEGIEFKYLIIEQDGRPYVIKDAGHITIVKGDHIKILDAVVSGTTEKQIAVNFVGFIPKGRSNNGRDTGIMIDTEADLIPKYSKDGEGKEYTITISKDSKVIGRVYADIVKPQLEYIVLRQNETKQWLGDGDVMTIYPLDKLVIIDVRTNIIENSSVQLYLDGQKINMKKDNNIIDFKTQSDTQKPQGGAHILKVMREGRTIGSATLKINRSIAGTTTFDQY